MVSAVPPLDFPIRFLRSFRRRSGKLQISEAPLLVAILLGQIRIRSWSCRRLFVHHPGHSCTELRYQPLGVAQSTTQSTHWFGNSECIDCNTRANHQFEQCALFVCAEKIRRVDWHSHGEFGSCNDKQKYGRGKTRAEDHDADRSDLGMFLEPWTIRWVFNLGRAKLEICFRLFWECVEGIRQPNGMGQLCYIYFDVYWGHYSGRISYDRWVARISCGRLTNEEVLIAF